MARLNREGLVAWAAAQRVPKAGHVSDMVSKSWSRPWAECSEKGMTGSVRSPLVATGRIARDVFRAGTPSGQRSRQRGEANLARSDRSPPVLSEKSWGEGLIKTTHGSPPVAGAVRQSEVDRRPASNVGDGQCGGEDPPLGPASRSEIIAVPGHGRAGSGCSPPRAAAEGGMDGSLERAVSAPREGRCNGTYAWAAAWDVDADVAADDEWSNGLTEEATRWLEPLRQGALSRRMMRRRLRGMSRGRDMGEGRGRGRCRDRDQGRSLRGGQYIDRWDRRRDIVRRREASHHLLNEVSIGCFVVAGAEKNMFAPEGGEVRLYS
jgi:hypothetical protein